MTKIKTISITAVTTSLMLALSLSFEYLIPLGYLATYVKPNPFEGILLIITFLFSLKMTFAIIFFYSFLLLFIKGFSWVIFIEVAALTMAMVLLVISFGWIFARRGLKTRIALSGVVVVGAMIILNALIITPTYLNLNQQLISFYWDVFPDKNFMEMIILVSNIFPIGGGILHGNIIKYTFVGLLGYFGIKNLQKIDSSNF